MDFATCTGGHRHVVYEKTPRGQQNISGGKRDRLMKRDWVFRGG